MSPSKDTPMETATAPTPKVAIKGFSLTAKPGSKTLSFATKNPSSSNSLIQPSSSTTLGKHPRAALHNGSDDEEEEPVRHEEVTGFDIREGGALRKENEKPEGPLVISRVANRDWREEIRRNRQKRRNLLPPEVQAQRRGEGKADTAEKGKDVVNGESVMQWGLSVTKKALVTQGDGSGMEAHTARRDGNMHAEATTPVLAEKLLEKTDDELAIEALMGTSREKKGPDLVIPTASANNEDEYARPITEEDAYRRAIRSAPDVSTLEDYERVPVEEFGAALLRGMGWKEGDTRKGRVERPKEVKRRQNLLGLGATELKGAEELGAWVQKSDPTRLRTGGSRGVERRPKANEYKEREERKRESRDDRYGGSHRRDRDSYRDRDRDRDRDRRR